MIMARIENDSTAKAYKIANREDGRKIEIYCKDRVEENLRQHVRGYSAWEERIVIDELIKKGALQQV